MATEVKCTELLPGYSACGQALGTEVSRSSCCCSVGLAWGPRCEQCPQPGTPEYDLVCPGGPGYHPNEKTIILEDINKCLEMRGEICRNGRLVRLVTRVRREKRPKLQPSSIDEKVILFFRCSNTFGSFMCTCDRGYRLDSAKVACVDINECSESQEDEICGRGNCINTEVQKIDSERMVDC